MRQYTEVLAFGGGPPSVALLVLAALKQYEPHPDIVLFADTGNEMAETMRLLPIYENFAAEHGMEFRRVQSENGPLKEFIEEGRGIPIPLYTKTGQFHRVCTGRWKIQPMWREARALFPGQRVSTHLGLTVEEAWKRAKDPQSKLDRNLWPLVEKRLRRQDCIDIIKGAGLPVPPPSACTFCPMHSPSRWTRLAKESPEEFQDAVELDTLLRERNERNGEAKIYLSDQRVPLKILAEGMVNQGELDLVDGECDSGFCNT